VGDNEANFVAYTREEFIAKRPKVSLWITAAEVVACLYLEVEAAQLRQQMAAFGGYAKRLFGNEDR
jgi:hypothetical protein